MSYMCMDNLNIHKHNDCRFQNNGLVYNASNLYVQLSFATHCHIHVTERKRKGKFSNQGQLSYTTPNQKKLGQYGKRK